MSDAAYATDANLLSDSGEVDVFVGPASFAQRRLWFIDQIDPGKPVYNVPSAFRISGELNHSLLERALNLIVSRHEVLRTTFRLVDGEPTQLIAPELVIPLPVVDLRTLPLGDRERELTELIARELGTSFDFGVGPLIRATLVQIDDAEYALSLTLHHIVTDMWSQDVLMLELTTIYEALRKNEAPPLAELPIQYADFASWQREQLQGEKLERSLAYWRRQLENVTPLEVPHARRRPATPSHRGRTLSFEVNEALTAALKQMATRENVSLFMLVLAAWKVLLSRYAAQTDISVGSPISNRSRAETEPLIGFFLNTLVLRTDLAGNPTFRELLARVRETVLGAFEHQDLPFETLVEALHPTRVAGQNPLFNLAFVLVHGDAKTWSLPGLTFTPIAIEENTAKFDLTLSLNESRGKISGTLVFNTDLFEEPFVAGMLLHFRTLLEGIAASPDSPIDVLPVLGAAERAQIDGEWNRTDRPFPADKTIHALFEEQVARSPDATAIVSEDRRDSYAKLNRRANQLARHLHALGITRGAYVGVCLERSPELITCLLGIAKAGAVYVPLDPSTPPDRLAFMLEATGSAFVLTRSKLVEVKGTTKAQVVDFDTIEMSKYEAGNLDSHGDGEDPAYVIFTSGSTGEPNGVSVPHRAIARLVINTDYAPLTADDAVAFAANPSFDAATWEIWGPLLNGGRVVITPTQVLLSARALEAHLTAHHVTALFVTTALFDHIACEAPEVFRSLRYLLFGGERVNPASVRRILAHGRPQTLLHVYGPTETTTFATFHQVESVEDDRVPIGRPIANTQVHLLDAHLESVPLGVTGEIHIGGPGLALGYLNAPELDRVRFIQHPRLGRLYKTGDLARRLPDGAIEFVGRIDHQIKLRGFRIEPGEVETTLRRVKGIGQCAVVAREMSPGDRRLIAYYTPNGSPPPPPAALRQELARTLPEYMVPSAFLQVPRFPLTSNGKLALRELPLPTVESTGSSTRTPDSLHAQLVEIWEELLGINRVGIDDDFFQIGGHSLLAVRMLATIEQRLGRRIPITVLFEQPTISNLARVLINELRQAATEEPVVAMNPAGKKRPFFFMHGDWTGGGFFCRTLAQQIGPDRPFHAVHPHGLLDKAMPRTIAAMATERLACIRALQPHGPYLLGGYCNGAYVAYEMARQLEVAGEQVNLLALLMADGKNYRFRHVHRLARLASHWHSDADARTATRFIAWKRRTQLFARWLTVQYESASRFLRASLDRKARLLRERFRRSAAGVEKTHAPAGDEIEDALTLEYLRALDSFVPGEFGGRVLLLWPTEETPKNGGDPAFGWSAAAREVQLVRVPGDHSTCIQQHAGLCAVGDELRRALDATEPAGPVAPPLSANL